MRNCGLANFWRLNREERSYEIPSGITLPEGGLFLTICVFKISYDEAPKEKKYENQSTVGLVGVSTQNNRFPRRKRRGVPTMSKKKRGLRWFAAASEDEETDGCVVGG